ncbi:hypothetical protein OG723_03215 [Streptomyces sp. NBC_01278]|uniref:hypothetical protein n=1 Tax=Streptomyces sp. NBC_01278 TaxID=2903809 RepID=UPI002E2F39F1|nr:hypothetical protein [Streptomyces sp. NBC_01278]
MVPPTFWRCPHRQGIEIAHERFGAPDAPPALLIVGADTAVPLDAFHVAAAAERAGRAFARAATSLHDSCA